MIIYKTTNLINGKIYVGQDSKNNPKYLGSGVIFLKAIKKYGKENFIKETIEYVNSFDELNDKEIYWIDKYNSTNKEIGYNITSGGNNAVIPKEILLKRSEKVKKEGTYKGKNNSNFKYDILKDDLYEKYILKNLKIDEIANFYGCHKTVISKNLKKYNIVKPLSNKYCFNKQDLYKYYMIDNLSYSSISKIYGCSNKTIFKLIKKYGWENKNTIPFIKEVKLTKELLMNEINILTKSEIVKKYNCSRQLLNYHLKKNNL